MDGIETSGRDQDFLKISLKSSPQPSYFVKVGREPTKKKVMNPIQTWHLAKQESGYPVPKARFVCKRGVVKVWWKSNQR